jgi:hypothetical protein
MSSSRSVAAARARRANDPNSQIQVQQQQQRPRSSIGSYSQIPRNAVGNLKQNNNHMNNINHMNNNNNNNNPPPPKPQISIGNAIALVSLRLGRLEQVLQENGNLGGGSLVSSSSSSSSLDSIMNRLVLLENNKPSTEIIDRLTRENKDLKNNLQKLLQSFTSFVAETNDKFADYDAALVELENKDLLKAMEQEQKEDGDEVTADTPYFAEEENVININPEKTEEDPKSFRSMALNIE